MALPGTAQILASAIVLVPSVAVSGQRDLLPPRTLPGASVPTSPGFPSLRLAWLDVSNVTVGVDGVARSEVGAIFDAAGLEVSWRRTRGGEETRPGEILVVLVDRLLVDSSRRPVLGATPTRPRRSPLVWIHVRSVRAALGLSRDSATHELPVVARRNLGVALGRVVAHEIVHAVVPSLRHGDELMAESLGLDHLTAPRLSVAPPVALAVRGALDGSASPARFEPGVLAAEWDIPAFSPTLTAERDARSPSEDGAALAR